MVTHSKMIKFSDSWIWVVPFQLQVFEIQCPSDNIWNFTKRQGKYRISALNGYSVFVTVSVHWHVPL